MGSIEITPAYKLILTYDIFPETHEEYLRFALGEFIPTVQEKGLYVDMIWHVAYGNYPIRCIEFVMDESQDIFAFLETDEWLALEEQFKQYLFNYSRKLVRYRNGFQV